MFVQRTWLINRREIRLKGSSYDTRQRRYLPLSLSGLASVSQAAWLINKFHLAVKATTSNVGVGRHRTNEPILGIYGPLVIVMSILADDAKRLQQPSPRKAKPVDAAESPRAKRNVDAGKELTRAIETEKNPGEGLCDGDIRIYSAKTKIEGEKHFSTCEQTVNE
ncbi:hypothetical protein CEK26_011909 [Fusarium fujikuroi]|nr:Uncharacterized protein Y057_3823 [Fusarium fujikuroi]KLO90439.1 Uncharacterized protein LW93_5904 [Fusarium fujikuroi]KLP15411.1 Uncharacterized protein LW94_10069 [Fusarium fujikuroi]QGI67954.1 hypothetical protein CEK27_011925 [Fusarium fujikuroi]QGI85186.1 hypothetical protein CEK25_011915 [Fusarium fujikuroi]